MPRLTKLVVAFEMEPRYLHRIHEQFSDLDVVVCAEREQLSEALDGAQALVGGGLTPELLARSPKLRWLHVGGAGVDRLLFPALIASDVLVTNNSGAHAPNIAEHLLAMMLAFARGLPELMRHQVRHEWQHPSKRFELNGQTLGVVGLGDIGAALAWRAAAIGMNVVGMRRRPETGELPRGVQHLYAPAELHGLLAESDHVAICLPLTARTRGLIGPAEFDAMRETAYIYNIGRGAIIDQPALIEALQAGHIAGAGLDVTEPEPLPTDSPLWDMPNVQITCHTSGGTPRFWERGIEILLTNIERFCHDEPLVNLVDKREGY